MSHQQKLFSTAHPAALIIRRLHRLNQESPNSELAQACTAFRRNLLQANDLGEKISDLLMANGFYDHEIVTCIEALCFPKDPSPRFIEKLQSNYERRAMRDTARYLTYRGVKYKQ